MPSVRTLWTTVAADVRPFEAGMKRAGKALKDFQLHVRGRRGGHFIGISETDAQIIAGVQAEANALAKTNKTLAMQTNAVADAARKATPIMVGFGTGMRLAFGGGILAYIVRRIAEITTAVADFNSEVRKGIKAPEDWRNALAEALPLVRDFWAIRKEIDRARSAPGTLGAIEAQQVAADTFLRQLEATVSEQERAKELVKTLKTARKMPGDERTERLRGIAENWVQETRTALERYRMGLWDVIQLEKQMPSLAETWARAREHLLDTYREEIGFFDELDDMYRRNSEAWDATMSKRERALELFMTDQERYNAIVKELNDTMLTTEERTKALEAVRQRLFGNAATGDRRIGEFRQLESVSRTAIPGVTYNPNRQQLVKDPQLQTTNRLLERLTLGGGVARAA